MKKIISLIMACILLLGLCACSSEPLLVSNDANQNAATPTEDGDKIFKLGDSVNLDDVVVTFLDIAESKGSTYNKPAEGKVFILCEFEIANNSSKELTVSSMLNFETYCDDYTCDTSFNALVEKGNKDQLDRTVAAGKKIKGVVGYEVPSDWKKLEIHYTQNILTSSKIIFVATND